MRSTRSTLLLTALATLAACGDDLATTATNPISAPGATPAMNLRPNRVSIRSYTEFVSNNDWGPAIDAAQQEAGTVEFPEGTYTVHSPVNLRSGTRLVGTGGVISYTGPRYAFLAQGTSTQFVTGITIDSLTIHGNGSQQQVALRVVNGGDVTLRGNSLRRIGLVESDIAGADRPTRDNLNYNFLVTGNYGDGERPQFTGAPALWGVYLAMIHTVTVSHNQFYNYRVGIQWWGGDAGAEKGGGYHQTPRLAQDWLVEHNRVVTNQEGIWGSMGEYVLVRNNYVENCWDVCLDDEGGNYVKFYDNEARYAGEFVMAVFDFAQGAEFVGNDVYQDGRIWPPLKENQPYHPGVTLFGTSNDRQISANIGITVRDNHFTYTGGSGVGRVDKTAGRRMDFTGNILWNTVIDMAPNNSGALEVSGNHLGFDRGTGGVPAIRAGGNHLDGGGLYAPTVDGTYNLVVANNVVESTAPQTAQEAIRAGQWSYNVLKSWIHHNQIRGFEWTVRTSSANAAHTFRVESNTLNDNPCGTQRFC